MKCFAGARFDVALSGCHTGPNPCALLIVLLGLAPLVTLGGGPPLQFAKMVGSLNGYAVASDSQSNVYVGTGPFAALVKYDSNGNRLWSFGVQSDGSHGLINIYGIVVDSNTVYVCGDLWGPVRAGVLTNDSGSSSLFFAKFTPTGSNYFATVFTNLHSYGKPFARSADGSFIVAGWSANEVRYQGITLSSIGDDTFVFKIRADGSPVWYRRGSGAAHSYPDNVVCLPNGDVTLVGTAESENFGIAGLNISNPSSRWMYLAKMDANGDGAWSKSVSSIRIGIPIPSAVAYSPTANAIIWAGDFSGNLNLVSPPIAGSGDADAFVAKLSPAGTVLWARKMGATLDQFALAAATDDFGNVYVAGSFQGSVTIGATTLTTLGDRDLYIAKFRDDGTPVWAKQIGWTGNDNNVALGFTEAGELLVTGTVRGGASIDGVFLEGANSSDAFIAKFYSEGVLPRFVTNPEDRIISSGITFTLTAELAINDPSVRFQWWFNGAPLAGRTNLTLAITNAQPNNAGSYFLVVTNGGGSVQSAAALISYSDAASLLLSIHPSLTIFGTPGRTYRIEYATQAQGPANWTMATNLPLNSSPQVWVDPTAAIGEKRFYRVVLLP